MASVRALVQDLPGGITEVGSHSYGSKKRRTPQYKCSNGQGKTITSHFVNPIISHLAAGELCRKIITFVILAHKR